MMIAAMATQNGNSDIPAFLAKTALGCSAVVILILLPFTINNFIQGRFIMGLATISVSKYFPILK